MDDRPEWFDALADRFRFVREIGRGGMARVYLAEDIRLHRPVAIKVLREELAHALAHDRFLAEIRVAAELNHPNIVPLYDSGIIPAAASRPPMPWFAMMYIAGESLKERLARGPLPVGEAVDVARAVAAALDYAHGSGRGVIHRDIKPANILLAGEVATVADFGIARALDRGGEEQSLTATGLTVGSPEYMSPEQAGADPALDHRTDVYSLGCVVYQMLAGHPPFAGRSPQAIIARHNLDPPPPLGTVRPGLPPGLIAAVEKALAKKPEDRWSSAGAFAHALRETAEHPAAPAPSPAWRRAWWTRRRMAIAGAAAAAVGAVGLALVQRADGEARFARTDAEADTTEYAVLPFMYGDPALPRLLEEEILRAALSRWKGIHVKDAFEVRDVSDQRHIGVPYRAGEAEIVARALGAGRFVRGAVSRTGDSLRVLATLYDLRTRRTLATGFQTVSMDLRNVIPALERLADTLLLRDGPGPIGSGPDPGTSEHIGTSSLPAWQAFARGNRAIHSWSLATAEDAFASAWRFDPDFAQAALWLSVVRSWAGQPTATWSAAASRAMASRDRLSGRDQAIAAAVAARSAGDLGVACAAWNALAAAAAGEFVAWYGLGDCLASDHDVIPDRRSPSGWAFRSSYHTALHAYQRAYELLPSLHFALRNEGFEPVRRLFMISPDALRGGRGPPPDSPLLVARPAWTGDSLALIPWPAEIVMSPGSAPGSYVVPNLMEAIRNQRQRFHNTAAAWVAAYPDSPAALQALALALEMLGDPSALDTLRRARRLATDQLDRLTLASADVWMTVRRAVPDDTIGLEGARRLADSLLAANPPDSAARPYELASLAALLGQATRARAYLRRPEVAQQLEIPPALAHDALALEVLAALRGPGDTLAALENRVGLAIERWIPADTRGRASLRWLAYPATLAYPDYRSRALVALKGRGDYLLDAIAAAEEGDSAGSLRIIAPAIREAEALGAGAPSIDQAPALAALHQRIGRPLDASGVLDDALNSLNGAGEGSINSPSRAASLVQAMALRSRIAEASGQGALAHRWGHAVATLWRNADDFLQPTVRRMARLEQ